MVKKIETSTKSVIFTFFIMFIFNDYTTKVSMFSNIPKNILIFLKIFSTFPCSLLFVGFYVFINMKLLDIISEQQIRYDAILIGGLDTRKTDKSLTEQISLLQNASGLKNIKGFRFNDSDDNITTFIKNNKNLPVVLFSKGCERTHTILNCKGVNPNRVFVIQPWAGSENSMSYYNNLSIPKNHIYVGGSPSTGLGIKGSTRCPQGMGHWESLPKIGGMVLSIK